MTLDPMAQDMEAAKGRWSLAWARLWRKNHPYVRYFMPRPWRPWGDTWG